MSIVQSGEDIGSGWLKRIRLPKSRFCNTLGETKKETHHAYLPPPFEGKKESNLEC